MAHGRRQWLDASPPGVARDNLGRGHVQIGANRQALLARPVAAAGPPAPPARQAPPRPRVGGPPTGRFRPTGSPAGPPAAPARQAPPGPRVGGPPPGRFGTARSRACPTGPARLSGPAARRHSPTSSAGRTYAAGHGGRVEREVAARPADDGVAVGD